MKESYIGFSISVIIHLFIISFMVIVPLRMQPLTKTILVDFTLIKGQGVTADSMPYAVSSRQYGASRGQNLEDSKRKPGDSQKKDNLKPETPNQRQSSEVVKNVGSVPGNRTLIDDPEGQVQVHREVSSGKDSMLMGQGSAQKGKNVADLSSTPGGGQGRALGYGDGNTDGKIFFYIRENIMKNIKYPEKARRMGWEGKVLLSFVIFENGSIHNIKVVNSSGFPLLDSSAREAIAKTTFLRKVPYRLVIVLPIEYKLE